jgi:predicted dehydrogenase
MTSVAVVGVGAMGRNHARVLRELPEVELVAVADSDRALAENASRLYGGQAYDDARQMVERESPEAVVVAVPTQAHFGIVSDMLAAGCHVLVEKPIAATVLEARQLVERAGRAGRVLMVGHIERYNPAVVELKRRLEAGELGRVFQIHTRRLGPFPERVRDVGVVVDLATHDLDIMRYLTGSEPVRVYAETRREIHSLNEDLFTGMVTFADDTLGLLEINWLTPTKIRELYVTGEYGMFRADYITQDLCFFENAEVNGDQWTTLSVLRGVREGAMTRFALRKKEPLLLELEAFLAAVHGDRLRAVGGRDGELALDLALALIESSQAKQVIRLSERAGRPHAPPGPIESGALRVIRSDGSSGPDGI